MTPCQIDALKMTSFCLRVWDLKRIYISKTLMTKDLYKLLTELCKTVVHECRSNIAILRESNWYNKDQGIERLVCRLSAMENPNESTELDLIFHLLSELGCPQVLWLHLKKPG